MMLKVLQRGVGSHTVVRPCRLLLGGARRMLGNTSSVSEYIEVSELPTDYFQRSLPRLPVPRVQDTCERYLRSQEAYMTDQPAEFEYTRAAVNRFAADAGQELQRELLRDNRTNFHTSYITEAWFDMYLSSRAPLPINFSPMMSWADDFSASQGSTDALEMRLVRLTNLVVSSLRFKRSLEENCLSPELYHTKPENTKTPEFRAYLNKLPLPRKAIWLLCAARYNCYALDVSQYARLFCASRVPRHEAADSLLKFGTPPPPTGLRVLDHANGGDYETSELRAPVRHIVVLRGGRLWRVEVLDSYGQLRPATQIYAALRRVATAPTSRESHPVAVLSSLDRNRWGALRAQLRSSQANRVALRDLESAIFAVAYDDAIDFEEAASASRARAQPSAPGALRFETARAENEPEVNQTLRAMLLGSGANRYWDKSMTLVSTPNGKFGVSFEHSWGDGVAVLRYIVDTFANARERPAIRSDLLQFAPTHTLTASHNDVSEIRFELDDSIKAAIDDALKDFSSRCASLDNRVAMYDKFGKEFLKQKKVSPDSIAQLSVQLAYFKQFGKFGASYESCSTAAFRHGRTETIRPLSVEVRDFILANEAARGNKHVIGNRHFRRCVSDWHVKHLSQLLYAASSQHGKLVVEAATGRGWDRHLFALRRIAEGRTPNSPTHSIPFTDPAYKRINHIVLSTSTLSDPALEAGGFGAVTPDGYGVGYAPLDNRMAAVVTNFPNSGTNVDQFVEFWNAALDDIHRALSASR